MSKLFPEYLDKGSKGPAVAMLQVILKSMGTISAYSVHELINIDGDYGENTAAAVKQLQHTGGLKEDGNFGPETRTWLAHFRSFDVNSLEAELFCGETTAA